MVKKEASDRSQSNDSSTSSNSSSSSTSLSATSVTTLATTSQHHYAQQQSQQPQFYPLSVPLTQQYQQANKVITSGCKPPFYKLNPSAGSDMQNLANQLAVAAAAQNDISYFQNAAADLTSAYSKLQPVAAAAAAAHLISAAAAHQQQQQNNSMHLTVGGGGGPNETSSVGGSAVSADRKEILLGRDLVGHFNAALKERPSLPSLVEQQSSSGSGRPNGGHHSSASSASSNSGGGPGGDVVVVVEETVRKREMRLLKNREAARECRRKKKEYIKCLENRVAVLETQNKTLIDELKSLKELYCQSGDSVPNH